MVLFDPFPGGDSVNECGPVRVVDFVLIITPKLSRVLGVIRNFNTVSAKCRG